MVIANAQSDGKGRHGKAFFSPADGGLYMSFLLSPERMGFDDATAITAYAAVCVCEAVEAACGIALRIKWVNDLMLNGKKVAGILTEAITELESGRTTAVVLGIGINVSTTDFPEEIRDVATSLFPDGMSRNQLAAEIINRILQSPVPQRDEFFTQYNARLLDCHCL